MAQETAPEVPSSAPESPDNTRRGLLVGAGLLGVAGVAAACGGDGGDETTDPDPGNAGGAGGENPEGSGGDAIAKTSAIPVGGGKIFKGQKIVITQPTEGEFKGFDINCTHRGCPVDSIAGDTINCPCHGSTFSIKDGAPTGGPADKPLKPKNVKVAGENITLA
jgi:nitrite reductase/ring-hydroxylating ferredoxin subunit